MKEENEENRSVGFKVLGIILIIIWMHSATSESGTRFDKVKTISLYFYFTILIELLKFKLIKCELLSAII